MPDGAPCPRPPTRASRASTRPSAGEVGAAGERLAAEHFERLGFRILARNVRSRAGEIDLIAFDGRTLVFAEVKTASTSPTGALPDSPLARLDGRQRARIRRLAVAWLCERDRPRPRARELRLDAVGVTVDRAARLVRLDHVESAW